MNTPNTNDFVYEKLLEWYTDQQITRLAQEIRIHVDKELWENEVGQARFMKLMNYAQANPQLVMGIETHEQGRYQITKVRLMQSARLVKDPSTIKPVRLVVSELLARINGCPVCQRKLLDAEPGSIKKACRAGCGVMELSTIGPDGSVGVLFHMNPRA